jgi:phage-related protein
MPERVKGVQRKATTPAEVRSPARRGPGAAAEGSATATVEMPAAAATGAERVKLFRYLQRTQGNAQVAQMVARLRPPAIRPAVALQRQATACPAPPKEPVSTPPDQDPKFTAVESKIKQQSKDLKKHPTAKSKAKEAQAAAEPPANERESKAMASQAETMGTAQPGAFDKAAFIAAVRKAIADASPKTLDDADKFASSGKAGEVKNQVMGKVSKGKEDSAKDVKEKSAAPPDPSRVAPKPVTPMREQKPGPAPKDPGAAKAMPGPAPADQTNLGGPVCETNAKMAEAGVTEEHLKKSNEPEMQQAVEAKKAGEEHSTRAPAEFREQEQQQLNTARQGATSETTSSLGAMQQTRAGALSRVGGNQSTAKSNEEKARADVSTHIDGLYNATKTEVNTILEGLDGKVSTAFTEGEAAARRAFEENHKTEMAKWKEKRYAGVAGAAQWVADLFEDLRPEAAVIYQRARDLYLQKMDEVISRIADLVGSELTRAKNRIQQGRDEIRKYVSGLSPELQKVGQEAQQAIASKFDELDQDVNSKQESLVNDLAQKYVEARNAVDEDIKKMQEENKGLWEQAKEAVGGAVEAILKLKDLFMTTLARAAGAFTKILEDPVAFIGNFMNAVKTGFMNFAGNILDHLKKGLLGWLFGALASAGIELPSSFDLKGILKLVASILGLTWGAIKARLVRLIPWLGPVIDFVEDKIEVVAAFVKDGLAGVWNWIKDRLGDLKEMILTPIKEFVVEKVVKAGITWILGLLNPAGALVKVVQALIGVVQWIMERGASLANLIRTVIDAVHDIAHGGMGGVPAKIEGSLGQAVPLVISFLANLLGLGGISEKIKSIIEAVQRPIGRAIDTVVGGAIKAAKGVLSRGLRLIGRRPPAPTSPEERGRQLAAGTAAMDQLNQRYAEKGATKEELESSVSGIRSRFPVFTQISIVQADDHWNYDFTVQTATKTGPKPSSARIYDASKRNEDQLWEDCNPTKAFDPSETSPQAQARATAARDAMIKNYGYKAPLLDAILKVDYGATPRAFSSVVDEDSHGGHTVEKHVKGMGIVSSDEALAKRILVGVPPPHPPQQASYFTSLGEANAAVASVINANWKDIRKEVGKGKSFNKKSPSGVGYALKINGSVASKGDLPKYLGGSYEGPMYPGDTRMDPTKAGLPPMTLPAPCSNVLVTVVGDAAIAGGWFVLRAFPDR